METAKPDRAPQLADKYVLRMPDGMRDKINERARANNRSMNAEIVLLLQQAMDGLPSTGPIIDIEALADALAPRLAAKLKQPQG